jgi:hypothetical protein
MISKPGSGGLTDHLLSGGTWPAGSFERSKMGIELGIAFQDDLRADRLLGATAVPLLL